MTTIDDTNPLPAFSNENVLLTGTFESVFMGCDAVERPTFDDPNTSEPALKLYFEVPSEQVTLVKIDRLRFSPKANLRRDLKQMAGDAFSPATFNNRKALWACIQELIGKRYTIACEQSESGAFTKITSITPARNGKPQPIRKTNGHERATTKEEEVNN